MVQATPTSAPSQAEQIELDDALNDTFPASDPPSMTDPTHGVIAGRPALDDDMIRTRAYEIWQNAGAPDGQHEDHWAQARRELEAEAETTRTPTTAEEVR